MFDGVRGERRGLPERFKGRQVCWCVRVGGVEDVREGPERSAER